MDPSRPHLRRELLWTTWALCLLPAVLGFQGKRSSPVGPGDLPGSLLGFPAPSASRLALGIPGASLPRLLLPFPFPPPPDWPSTTFRGSHLSSLPREGYLASTSAEIWGQGRRWQPKEPLGGIGTPQNSSAGGVLILGRAPFNCVFVFGTWFFWVWLQGLLAGSKRTLSGIELGRWSVRICHMFVLLVPCFYFSHHISCH